MLKVKNERTGWRDLALSERHRKWGWDCPAIDLDFLFLEYDKGQPVAIVEYKHERAAPQYASHPTYQAMINLGTRAGIPVFCARYKSDFSSWIIISLNNYAHSWLPERTEMTEREWVTFLYKIRGYIPPEGLFEGALIKI
uniref:Uncharacterized protein n=1 Tax=Candidatus Desulfatibia profunda TaxID=2841695 RepID=A0A8J6TID4_9BACT|nr:hypothetical protein [Candidatus Desulfatibia profunda]